MIDGFHDRNQLARNATRSLLFLYFATSIVGIAGWYVASVTNLWHWYVALVVSGAFALVVTLYRNISLALSNTLFLLNTSLVMFCISFQTYKVAEAGRWSAVAFAGYKLMALSVATIAPVPVWSAYLVIGLCAIIPTVQTLLAPAHIRPNYTEAEPWVSVIYALVAFLVLRHRLRAIELERKMSTLEAERGAIDHLARIFLGLRDLTNTPVQSIELTAWLLKKGHLTPNEGADQLQGTLVRFRELSEILTSYEKEIDWSKKEHAFDAAQLVQERLTQIKAHQKTLT